MTNKPAPIFAYALNRWNYPEPILVLLLFFPSKREAKAMVKGQATLTDLEKLGIWAARRAREEAKKEIKKDIDDLQRED